MWISAGGSAMPGLAMGFVPGAFVWHWRRPSVRAFLRQQTGYGNAEKILMEKHPHRFKPNGEARWEGFVYGGGSVRAAGDSIIYYGSMGQAGYQSIVNRMLPLRPVDSAFRGFCSTSLLLPRENSPTRQSVAGRETGG